MKIGQLTKAMRGIVWPAALRTGLRLSDRLMITVLTPTA